MTLTVHEKLALDTARLAQSRAHAPYSGKQVGAAVITTDGQVFAACNVENPDSTLRICAERNAIAQTVASGKRSIASIVVIAPDDRFWPPCDLCRLVIEEFAENPRIILSNREGRLHIDRLHSLPILPFSANGQEPVA
jgi:cytidine deaminase